MWSLQRIATLSFMLLSVYATVTTAWTLRMRPQLSIQRKNSNFLILCQSDSKWPLVECGFQVSHDDYYDLSQGASTPPKITPHYKLEYFGVGLQRGQCGIKVTHLANTIVQNFGCRARVKNSEWKYDFTTIWTGVDEDTIPYTIEPRHEVVLPGSNKSIVFRVDEPLSSCQIKPPSLNSFLIFNDGIHSNSATSHFRYYGNGLANGECGLTVLDVTEKDNEWMSIIVETISGKRAYSTSLFPVAKPPTQTPRLTLSQSEYEDGDLLEAECIVEESRPPANITWHLGDSVISGSKVKDVPNPRWRWKIDPEERTQKVKLEVSAQHDGLLLTCEASHVGLRTKLQTSETIIVKATPGCGKRGVSRTLVAGGQDAGIGEFPWQAGLYASIKGKYTQFCGGTLIAPDVVITAAHCVHSEISQKVQNSNLVKVVLGKLFLDWNMTAPNDIVQRLEVAEIYVHPRYRGRRSGCQYDIAVLKLRTKATITGDVNVACVDWNVYFDQDFLTSGIKGTVAGWGLSNSGDKPSILQWVDLPWVDEDTCYNAIPVKARIFLTNDKFCAGYVNQSTSVCQGDSGGGFMVLDPTSNRYYLRGVVSTHLHIGQDPTLCYSQLYTTFTSFAYQSRWVKEKLIADINAD